MCNHSIAMFPNERMSGNGRLADSWWAKQPEVSELLVLPAYLVDSDRVFHAPGDEVAAVGEEEVLAGAEGADVVGD
jgi:hypothetical protein